MDFKEIVLTAINESPDFVADRFNRTDPKYGKFLLFIGCPDGVFLKWKAEGLENHSRVASLLRFLKVVDPKNGYKVLTTQPWKRQGGIVLGNPKKIGIDYTGIIMPKQSDMDGTYISFWALKAFPRDSLALKELLKFTKEQFPGPYFIDNAPEDFSLGTPSTVTPA